MVRKNDHKVTKGTKKEFLRYNHFSKIVLGIGVVDAWKLADATKLQTQKARTLAESKNLRQAVLTAQKAISAWSKQPGFWERLLRSYKLGDTLEKINQDSPKWQAQVTQASELLNGAKSLLQQDNNNPHETKILLDALELCKRAGKILHDEQISQEEALKPIQKISIIDDNNHVVLDLIERLEFAQQLDEFHNLMKRGLYEEAVEKALIFLSKVLLKLSVRDFAMVKRFCVRLRLLLPKKNNVL